ncbi:hypothetical protein AAFF_G00275040 [Aldrovandia affinis]|uniref:Uncharacterized protein n=1 Tax=Aldrovandia affinis TaxID=143900 RepID=A0AAD7ST25_9TELE|nr:hypothetical protein AAFF_G00275040 [Aldrovandia affinis]
MTDNCHPRPGTYHVTSLAGRGTLSRFESIDLERSVLTQGARLSAVRAAPPLQGHWEDSCRVPEARGPERIRAD